MPCGYHHLTQDERCQIYGLKKSGLSHRAIGRELGRHHTAIGREIKQGQRRAWVPLQTGPRQGDGPAPSGVFGGAENDG